MIRKLPLVVLLILAVADWSNAYNKLKREADCRKIIVQDPDRRGFDDRSAFPLDVDGDGRPDTITSRIYKVRVKREVSGKNKAKTREKHWISFDAKTRSGQVLHSFFKYQYGTDEADYWVYAWVPCRINKGREAALLFYSGDDSSEDTKVLVKREKSFKVYWRKKGSLGF